MNLKNRTLIKLLTFSLVFSLVLSTTSLAFDDKIIKVSMIIYKNNTAFLDEVKSIIGNVNEKTEIGDYKLLERDKDNKVLWHTRRDISFVILTRGKVLSLKKVVHSDKLPFFKNLRWIELQHNETVLFKEKVDLCDKNFICQGYENYLSCPLDCPLAASDEYCVNKKDGVCDPDCLTGADPDCELSLDKRKKVFTLKGYIYPNDTVQVLDLSIKEGKPSPLSGSGDYEVKVISAQGRLLDKFFKVNGKRAYIYLRLPYSQEASFIKFYHKGKKIFSLDLNSYLCGEDGECSEFCKGKKIDPDCKFEETTTTIEEKPTTTTKDKIPEPRFPWLVVLVVLVILGIIGYIVWEAYKSRREYESRYYGV